MSYVSENNDFKYNRKYTLEQLLSSKEYEFVGDVWEDMSSVGKEKLE